MKSLKSIAYASTLEKLKKKYKTMPKEKRIKIRKVNYIENR
jgi:hypothetical protein